MTRVDALSPVVRSWLRQIYADLPCETHSRRWELPVYFDPAEVARLRTWKAFDRRRLPLERKYAREVYAQFTAIRTTVTDTMRFAPRALNVILQITGQEVNRRIPRVYRDMYLETEREFLKRVSDSVVNKAAQRTKADDEVIDVFQLPELVAWNDKVLAERIVQVSRYTMDVVKRVVSRAIDVGTGIDLVAMQLEGAFAFSRTRAERIARTEIVGTSNAANFFGALNFVPDLDTKTWIATRDRRTRRTHREAGKTQIDIPYSEPFSVGGSLLMFPGDPTLGAAAKEIIQCRCGVTFSTRPVSVEEMIEDARRRRR